MSGFVDEFVKLSKRRVKLNEVKNYDEITIELREKYFFNILSFKLINPEYFKYSVKQVSPMKYILRVENNTYNNINYYSMVYIVTDKLGIEIPISILGNYKVK